MTFDIESAETEIRNLKTKFKQDVNLFFMRKRSAEEYEKLLNNAQTLSGMAIDALDPASRSIMEDIRSVMLEMVTLPDYAVLHYVEAIGRRVYNDDSERRVRALMEMFRDVMAQCLKQTAAGEHGRDRWLKGKSAAYVVQRMRKLYSHAGIKADYTVLANIFYRWVSANKGKFFRTPENSIILVILGECYHLNSKDRDLERSANAFLQEVSGEPKATIAGKVFRETIVNLGIRLGRLVKQVTWLHTDRSNYTITAPLFSDTGDKVVVISKDDVSVQDNGCGTSNGLVDSRGSVSTIEYHPDCGEEPGLWLDQLIFNNLAMPAWARLAMKLWSFSVYLIDFTSIKPYIRALGSAGSGKSLSTKLLSAWLLGIPEPSKSTVAAAYADGARTLLLVFDNYESNSFTAGLKDFILSGCTGVAKHKRRANTDSEVIREVVKTLIILSSIESAGPGLSELFEREFALPHDVERYGKKAFLETEVIHEILEKRDLMLSWLFQKTSIALRLISEGAQKRVMEMLEAELGSHHKKRANSFFAVMYIMHQICQDRLCLDEWTALDPVFVEMVQMLNQGSEENARDGHPVAALIEAVFRGYWVRQDDGEKAIKDYCREIGLTFHSPHAIIGITGNSLFTALRSASKKFSLPFSMNSALQLGQRLNNDLATLKDAGIIITKREIRKKHNVYDIVVTFGNPKVRALCGAEELINDPDLLQNLEVNLGVA